MFTLNISGIDIEEADLRTPLHMLDQARVWRTDYPQCNINCTATLVTHHRFRIRDLRGDCCAETESVCGNDMQNKKNMTKQSSELHKAGTRSNGTFLS